MTRPRVILTAAVAGAGAVLLAGCGSSSIEAVRAQAAVQFTKLMAQGPDSDGDPAQYVASLSRIAFPDSMRDDVKALVSAAAADENFYTPPAAPASEPQPSSTLPAFLTNPSYFSCDAACAERRAAADSAAAAAQRQTDDALSRWRAAQAVVAFDLGISAATPSP